MEVHTTQVLSLEACKAGSGEVFEARKIFVKEKEALASRRMVDK